MVNFTDFTDGGIPSASDYLVGYAAGGAVGSDRRWLRSSLAEAVSVVKFGAVADGATDCTSAIQACATYCAANNKAMYIPGSALSTQGFRVSGTIDVSNVSHIFGDGIRSQIVTASATADVFYKNSALNGSTASVFKNFTVWSSVVRSAGAYFHNAVDVDGDIYDGLFLFDPWIGIHLAAGSTAKIVNCLVRHPVAFGFLLQNDTFPDEGDHSIVNNTVIGSAGGSAVALCWRSGGGLRVIGNKFNQADGGVLVNPLLSTVATSQLIIEGNSFDSNATYAIKFDLANANTGSTLESVLIVGNYFGGHTTPISVTATGGDWLSRVKICGNEIGYTVNALDLANGSLFQIGENLFVCGAGGNPAAIKLAATRPTLVQINANIYNGTTTAYALNTNTSVAQETPLAAAADPSGVVAAPKGTLFIKTDATTTTSRLFINIDGGTTWATFTTSA